MRSKYINTKYLQKTLKKFGLYNGAIDGKYGRGTKKAVMQIQEKLKEYSLYYGVIDGDYGPLTKKAVMRFQRIHPPLASDGIIGPKTIKKIFVKTISKRENGKELSEHDSNANTNEYPLETRDQRYIKRFYGEPGPSNLVKVKLPYKMRLAWDKSKKVTSILCHKKVANSMKSIFKDILKHYGYGEIVRLGLDLYGGCYNKRKMRGANRWSMHSWGIAVDLDPSHNQLRMHKPKARFSHKDYDAFWGIVEKYGATSLGREKDYDWMHFQFARRS